MKENKNTLYSALAICVIFFSIFFLSKSFVQNDRVERQAPYVLINEKIIYVDIAETQQEQTRGLSGREKLEEGKGMLFIFGLPGEHGFWMKDMKFAIDIIWINEDKKIIYIKKNAQPESYPSVFVPKSNSKYVLEVPGGFSEKNGIKEGDAVDIVI